jgi:hypothetical protein
MDELRGEELSIFLYQTRPNLPNHEKTDKLQTGLEDHERKKKQPNVQKKYVSGTELIKLLIGVIAYMLTSKSSSE